MEPIKFKEVNKTLKPPVKWDKDKNGKCGDLPIFTDSQQNISLWKLSWKERWQILKRGKIWLGIYSGPTQPVIWLDTQKTVFKKD